MNTITLNLFTHFDFHDVFIIAHYHDAFIFMHMYKAMSQHPAVFLAVLCLTVKVSFSAV